MSHPPMFYTLTQVKFNTIEKMIDTIPNLQEEFRKDYPDFQQEFKKEFSFKLDPIKSDIQTKDTHYWSFCNIGRTEGYILFPNSLIFHTTNYHSFTEFSEKMISGLRIVHENIGLSFIEQIGLRYLNTVQSKQDEPFEKYLNPSLLGLSSELKGQLVHNISETIFEIDNGRLVVKSLIRDKGLALPPDIQPHLLNFKVTVPSSRNATLDIDFFIIKRELINIENIKKTLYNAHSVIENVFLKSITAYARELWR